MTKRDQLWESMEHRPILVSRTSIYRPLLDELTLRLERTPPKEEIVVTFHSSRHARSAQRTLHRLFVELRGHRTVRIGLRDNKIFVRRGKNWPGKPVARLPDE